MERGRSRSERRKARKQEEAGANIDLLGGARLGPKRDLAPLVQGIAGHEVAIHEGIPVFGRPMDEATLVQMNTCLSEERAAYGVLMADNHRGYSMPVGGVIAYRRAVSPTGVGFDIGCGVSGVRTNLSAVDLGVNRAKLGLERTPEIERIMNEVVRRVRFGIGLSSTIGRDHAIFEDPRWKVMPEVEKLRQDARNQLGTVGAGNHYVDLLLDEQDRVWVACHFGSRGFGHKTASGFLNLASGRAWDAKAPKESDMAPATILDLDTPTGDAYWTAMELAGEYAQAGRSLVNQQVAEILGGDILEVVENNHNEAWREKHDVGLGEEELIVVRKGATPAFPGQQGFVGGSMGDDAVIVSGVDTPKARAALRSTVHGAGRQLSRTQAAGKMNYKTRERTGGQVTAQMMQEWIGKRGVVLRGADTDESPQAYKRLSEVVAAHDGAIKIDHVLRPIGVAMAGHKDEDPYKD